jgi:hypothetical protein
MSSETTPTAFSIRPDDCPSELELDKYHLGELNGTDTERVEAYMEQSDFARQSLTYRESGFAAYPEVDVDLMVSEIHVKTVSVDFLAEEGGGSLIERFYNRWFGSGMLVAAGVACAVLFLEPVPQDSFGEDSIRSKGAPAELVVHRKTTTGSEPVSTGTVFGVGDEIRFQVDIPNAGHGMLVSRDNAGVKSVLYPRGKLVSAATDVKKDEILPGAFTLDAVTGSEWVFWVHCNTPFQLSDLRFGDVPGILIPAGPCSITSFELKKE